MVFRSRQKLKLLKRSQLNIESLEHRLVLDSTVVLNELMYHPHTDDAGGEWIELHNQMGVNMDRSGCRYSGTGCEKGL